MTSIIRAIAVGFTLATLSSAAFAQSDSIKVVGTGDGIDLLRAMAADFHKLHPRTAIEIPPSVGSGGGIAAVGSGKAQVGRVARELKDSEKASQIEYVPIAKIPSAIMAHPSAGITGLTSGQLADIYSGKISNWAEVGGADVRIRRVRREDEDSTLGALRKNMPGWKDLVITDNAKTAVTTQEAIETVRAVAGAIGLGPYSRFLGDDLTVLRIDGKFPDEEGYPSSVELALIFRRDLSDPGAKAFVDYSTSESARKIMRSFGAVPTHKKL